MANNYLKPVDIENVEAIPVGFRPYTEADRAFVLNSMLKGLYDPAYRHCSYTHFTIIANVYVEKIVDKTNILMTYDTTDPSSLYGWCSYAMWNDQLVIYWIYTKKTFRRLGLAKLLYGVVNPNNKMPIAIHWTNVMNLIMDRYPVYYNPFLAADINWSEK